MDTHPAHVACIVGGGIAGSEAAARLAERKIHSVVLEMEALPYGKIELGLPKWHAKQRDQEERRIDQNLDNRYVHYVPNTKLGSDISLAELQRWGFSAILLAVGAWRDRPLAVPGIEELQGKGFYYQNPFVAWFNQYHEPDYEGPKIDLADDAMVIGGGLASIDIVKILMLELTHRTLRDRGFETDIMLLEKKGIPKALESLGVTWEDLGLKGCTLYYRRRACDMPLVPLQGSVSREREEKAQQVRQKVLENARAKYLFGFEPCHLPVATVVEDGYLTGMVFQRTEVTEHGVVSLPGTERTVMSPLVISSIGSLPEPIPGVPMKWELYSIADEEMGSVVDHEGLFALGNAVTGRGNIRASRLHAQQVSERVMEDYLKWTQRDSEWIAQDWLQVEQQERFRRQKKLLTVAQIQEILEKVARLQRVAGYDGNYADWIEKNLPVRIENLKA